MSFQMAGPLRPCGPPLPHAGEVATYRLRFGSPACGGAGERSETERAACGKAAAIFCSAGARGPGRVFRFPLPRPSGLPTHPQRPGDVPLDPKEEGRSGRLAEKALYCALEENAHRFFRAPAAQRSDSSPMRPASGRCFVVSVTRCIRLTGCPPTRP